MKPVCTPLSRTAIRRFSRSCARKQAITDDLDKLMTEALEAYAEEFKDTIK